MSPFRKPISTATFPLLSKLKPEDSIFKTVYQNIVKYESMIVFPVTFAIIGLSNQSIDLLYGPTYHQASLYLQIYILSSFLVGIGGSVNHNLLNSQKHTKVTFQSTVITLILSIILGFPLIPRYGVIGRLVVFLVAPTAGLLYTTIWLRRNYELNPDYWNVMELFTSAGIGFLVCRAFVTYVNMNTWLEFFFGGSLLVLTYLILILLTGALKKENLRDIQNIAKTYTFLNFILDPLFRVLTILARK